VNPWEDPRVRVGLPRQLALLSEAERSGARPIGWKVGFGAPASLELMQIEAPLLGYLTDQTLLPDGAEVEVGDWARGVVEFEVAVRIDAPLGAGTTPEQAKAAVGALAPSIELADVHLAPGPDVVADILESDIFHRAVIVGPWDEDRPALDVDGLLARIEVDGRPFAETSDLQAITGTYDEVVATVANTLASFGAELKAGDLIITGSVIPPVSVGSGTDFVFALDPLPPLSVRCVG
jgi:2-keto-4-pentenoate hydratase